MVQWNRFEVLSQVYRDDRDEHGDMVRMVAVLVNRRTAMKRIKKYSTVA